MPLMGTAAWCGVSHEVFLKISEHVGVKNAADEARLFLLMAMAKFALTWDSVFNVYELHFAHLFHYGDESGLRKSMTELAKRIQRVSIRPQESRFDWELIGADRVTHLVDCFPVRSRLAAKHFNGKYRAKVFKFQGVTDLVGNLIEVKFVGMTMSDLKAFREHGVGFDAGPGEVGLGDRAYVTCENLSKSAVEGRVVTPLVVPPKETTAKNAVLYTVLNNSAEMNAVPSELQKHLPEEVRCLTTTISPLSQQFGKYHQLVRSPVERAFSRLHTWNIMKFSPFEESFTTCLVHMIALADSHNSPQEATDYVRKSPGRAPPNPSDDAHQETVVAMMRKAASLARESLLVGKNSKKRGKNDSPFKRGMRKMTKKQKDSFCRALKTVKAKYPIEVNQILNSMVDPDADDLCI